MIDTDKYEGHTEGEWRVDDKVGLVIKHGEGTHDYVDMENKANAQLMADAPKLLAEVKRLREAIADVADDMVENLPNNLRVYVSKLRKVIE
jgi:hypothetical protein